MRLHRLLLTLSAAFAFHSAWGTGAFVQVVAPDIATGRDVLSQAKWRSVVARAMPDLQQVLTKGQLQKLQMISTDLDRGAAAVSAGKVSGSDTAANLVTGSGLSVANVVGRVLGNGPKQLPPGIATAARPLAFLYKLPDEAIKSKLVDAMLDPTLAARLIARGTTENVRAFAAALAESSRAATTGAATGSASRAVPQ